MGAFFLIKDFSQRGKEMGREEKVKICNNNNNNNKEKKISLLIILPGQLRAILNTP